jgi:hypothetical protein
LSSSLYDAIAPATARCEAHGNPTGRDPWLNVLSSNHRGKGWRSAWAFSVRLVVTGRAAGGVECYSRMTSERSSATRIVGGHRYSLTAVARAAPLKAACPTTHGEVFRRYSFLSQDIVFSHALKPHIRPLAADRLPAIPRKAVVLPACDRTANHRCLPTSVEPGSRPDSPGTATAPCLFLR